MTHPIDYCRSESDLQPASRLAVAALAVAILSLTPTLFGLVTILLRNGNLIRRWFPFDHYGAIAIVPPMVAYTLNAIIWTRSRHQWKGKKDRRLIRVGMIVSFVAIPINVIGMFLGLASLFVQ